MLATIVAVTGAAMLTGAASPDAPGVAAPLGSAPSSATSDGRFTLAAGTAWLGNGASGGAAIVLGGRVALTQWLGATLDLGYGLLSGGREIAAEDRWWAVPGLELAVPVSVVTFELGAGAGCGTLSGYTNWGTYVAKPFGPAWHVTSPAVLAQVAVVFPLTSRWGAMVRGDLGTLLAESPVSPAWAGLTVGVQVHL